MIEALVVLNAVQILLLSTLVWQSRAARSSLPQRPTASKPTRAKLAQLADLHRNEPPNVELTEPASLLADSYRRRQV